MKPAPSIARALRLAHMPPDRDPVHLHLRWTSDVEQNARHAACPARLFRFAGAHERSPEPAAGA